MRDVEKYIPAAMRVLEESFPNGKIPKVYNGYIASLGASIFQSGLKASLALFEDKQANTKGDRSCLLKIIYDILVDNPNISSREKNCSGESLLRYVLAHQQEEELLKEKILDIAVAVKLAMRTFELEEKEQK